MGWRLENQKQKEIPNTTKLILSNITTPMMIHVKNANTISTLTHCPDCDANNFLIVGPCLEKQITRIITVRGRRLEISPGLSALSSPTPAGVLHKTEFYIAPTTKKTTQNKIGYALFEKQDQHPAEELAEGIQEFTLNPANNTLLLMLTLSSSTLSMQKSYEFTFNLGQIP